MSIVRRKVRLPYLNREVRILVPARGRAATVERKERCFEVVSFDITNHCNARCPFCFNDWSNIQPCQMDREVLEKGLSLLPLTEKNGFYLSCLYEPTIHPRFGEYLRAIPDGYRDRMFFTTNLVRKLSDEELRAMSQAPVDHINISIETLDPQKHLLLAGVKNSAFHENLENLAGHLSRAENPPKSVLSP